MTPDASTIIILFTTAGVVGALIGILPAWRRFRSHADDLPVWKFIARTGAEHGAANGIAERAVFEIELRCALCAARKECEQRLSFANAAPVSQCPNAALFLGVNEIR